MALLGLAVGGGQRQTSRPPAEPVIAKPPRVENVTSTQPASAPRRRPTSRPDSCSLQWDEVTGPAWGTAAGALFWLAIEQPGPWGSHAFQQSRMDPGLGRALQHQCASEGGRALLIRNVGSQREMQTARTRRVFIAGGMPHWQPWLLTAELADVADLLRLPWRALRHGDQRAVTDALPKLAPAPDPQLLVCTNAKRDVCCAVRGRPLAAEAAAAMPGQVWECTHTGGHRFAPTAVVLPHGQTLGRLTLDIAVDALQAAAQGRLAKKALDPRYNRGLPHVMPQLQAAAAWVRHQTGETGIGCVRARSPRPLVKGQSGIVEVEHRDGRHWLLHVRQVEDSQDLRRNSCSTAAVPVHTWSVDPVAPDVPVLGAWPAWPDTTPASASPDQPSPPQTPADPAPESDKGVLAALMAREPILHRREVVATLADADRELAADYWEWAASGTRYERDAVMAVTAARLAAAGPDPYVTQRWQVAEPELRRLGLDTYHVTYTLRQGSRVTRRSTIWRGSLGRGWQIVFHQGTPVKAP